MAQQNISYVCCSRVETSINDCVPGLGSNCGGQPVTITINSVTSPNTFGIFNNSYLLSRTCAAVQTCLPGLGACSGSITVISNLISGCFPKSLFPITVTYTINKTGVGNWQNSRTFNSGSEGATDCPPAGSICSPACQEN